MSSIKNKSRQQKQRLVLSTAVAAVLGVGATGASAEQVSATVEHNCPLPLIGEQTLTSEITTELPAELEVGEETGPIELNVVTTLPADAQSGLSLAGGDTLEGTAEAENTINLPNRDQALNATLTIPQQNIPSESGPFTVNSSGTVPSQSFTEDDIGQAQVVVGDLTLNQQVRDSSGNLVGDPVGEFTADCTITSTDNVLQEFEIVDGGGPVQDPANIEVDPQQLDFGETAPGDPMEDRTQSVAVNNTGDLDLGINNVTIQGNDAGAFNQTNDCTTVAGGQSCGVDVTYTPDATLDRDQTATLVIDSTDQDTAQVEVPLTGTPIPEPQPEVTVDPESITFGPINENEASGVVTQEVVVGNTGNASLNITGVQVSGDNVFAQTNNCSTVASDASCSISVEFNAGSAGIGEYSGTLSINNNDEDRQVPVSASIVEVDEGVKVDYDLVGSTIVSASDALVELTGQIMSTVDLGSGDVTADLALDPTTTEFEIIKLFTSIKGRADIEFEPVGETTGTLENGQLTTTSKLNIKVPEANVVIWGHELRIGGGTECQTREPAEITLQNQGDNFQPLDGGVVEGVYDLPELEHCGLLTGVLNKFMSGPDNPIELELNPQNNE